MSAPFLCTECEDAVPMKGSTICQECQNAMEAAYERSLEGEPPKSLDELHREAWNEKQRLHRR